jgi:hypothetical protein
MQWKLWIVIVAAIFVDAKAHAQSDSNSGSMFLPSCVAAADIVLGKRPAADSEDAARQLRLASRCFVAVTAIMKLESLFRPEFTMCPPSEILGSESATLNRMVFVITDHLKRHPEQLPYNFHQTAVKVLAAAWHCRAGG